MKKSLLLFFLLACCFRISLLSAQEDRQRPVLQKRIRLHSRRETLKEALDQLSAAAAVSIIYSNERELKTSVKIEADYETVGHVLERLLAPFPLTYRVIDDRIIIIPIKTETKRGLTLLSGKIMDEHGQPLAGATVKTNPGNHAFITRADGSYTIHNLPGDGILTVSFIGYQTKYFYCNDIQPDSLNVQLIADASALNQVEVIGYGTTSRRLSTGSISTVSAKEIEEQPVTNVLEALSGRAAGVNVQTNNGLPGGDVSVQIRGTGSLSAGTNPLYIIDGVPFASTSLVYNTALSGGINGAISPFNSLNPQDIETISILKDADATAIYGSRGANGVVLITTKKGKSGQVRTDINISQGISQVANLPKLLDLKDYLTIRAEAFKNDGLTPSADPTSPAYAPDLTVWNAGQSTNWAKYMLGGTGDVSDIQASISGGNNQTTFDIGANYRTSSTVLPGNNRYDRGGFHLSIQHTSADQKFNITMLASYTQDNNQLVSPAIALSGAVLLPPDFPIYNANGTFNFLNNVNPLASLLNTSSTQTNNIIANAVLSYNLVKGLQLKISGGINNLSMKQVLVNPAAAQDPSYDPESYTYFGNNSNYSVILEPQINYSLKEGKSALNLLLGGTWQKTTTNSEVIYATDFNSESLLQNLASAAVLYPSNSDIDYKYASVFGRVNYNWDDQYLVNVSVRRDGSSRFGPGNQYGNFGAIGIAWLFSNGTWAKKDLAWLSSGKIRSSYGITGNDQISDYQYLSTYQSSNYVYQNINGLAPSKIANNEFHWETNKKFELGLDLGFLKDRLLLTADRYQNHSGDQLVNYAVPYITGFNSYEANLPANIRTAGWELQLSSHIIQKAGFSWSSSVNFTTSENILESFPGLATSSYSNIYILGQSISRAYGFPYAGADPQTGGSMYRLKSGGTSANPSFDNFYNTIGDKNPAWYGGLDNSINYKNFQLNIFAQFEKHSLPGGLVTPGSLSNDFYIAINRWQQPGDITNIPKPTTSTNDFYYSISSANYFNATYLRLKNVSLSYSVPDRWLRSAKISKLRVYIQGENLATLWNRDAALYDPESGAFNVPPLRTIIMGIQLTL